MKLKNGTDMESMSRENLIQRAADGELTTPQEVAAFERHLAEIPADGAVVEDIRQLREAVARVMGGEVAVPADLRERIVRALELVEVGVEADAVIGRVDAAVETRQQRRWLVPSGFAAGILLLVGAAFLISLMTKNVIDPNLVGGTGNANTSREIPGPAEWLHTNLSDASGRLHDELGAEYGVATSLQEHDLNFLGMKLDVEMFGSFALHYASSTEDTSEATHWILQLNGVEFGVPVNEMTEGVAYLIENEADSPLNGCLSWRTGEIVHFFRCAAGGAQEIDQMEVLARTLGMPAGEVVKMP